MAPDPDLTIVLLGNTGVGKSASGNTILGQSAFESKRSFAPVTKQICEKRGNVFGKQISVVDTPGIFGSEDVIQTDCQELLQSSRPCLFLIVVKIDQFNIEQKNAVDAAMRVIGDDGFKQCYLLFTRGDDLGDTTLDEFINEDPDGPLKPLAEKFAGRLHVFNNKNGGQEQVRELLKKSGHLTEVAQPMDDRRIVLLGLPGKGKSASGNTILGSNQFESSGSFNSVTAKTVSASATVEGRQVTVVDTPGFTDEVLTPRQLYREILGAVVEAKPGPHAFVFVISIDRVKEADVKLFELLPKLFDSEDCKACEYSMVLFTHGNKIEKGKSIDDMIKKNKYVSDLVSMCGGRYCVFDNKDKGNREQVRNLLGKIDEMVKANRGEHFTNVMFRMDKRVINEEINTPGKTDVPTESDKKSEDILSYNFECTRPMEMFKANSGEHFTNVMFRMDKRVINEEINTPGKTDVPTESDKKCDNKYKYFLAVLAIVGGAVVGGAVVGGAVGGAVGGVAVGAAFVKGAVIGAAAGAIGGGIAGYAYVSQQNSHDSKNKTD